ncbi:hypothetical protein ACQUFY_14380 [Robbsia andropogonis]|uniref:hypothetical protein n=1 Tax=Robbsia andropogonis TaxID=28092 RepID=UPI003D23368A
MARKSAQADASASFAEWAELAGLRRALADAAIARERARLEAAERAAQAPTSSGARLVRWHR